MTQLYESLRRVLLLLRASGHQQIYIPGKPDTYFRSTDVAAASRVPAAYSLEECLKDEHLQASSSSHTQVPLHVDIREPPRRGSTTTTFSPSGTTFVSSPITVSPRGSLPLPSDKSDPDKFKPRVSTPTKSRRYDPRPSPVVCSRPIPAGPLSVSRGRKYGLPSDWQEYIHPEDAYAYESEVRNTVSDFADKILARVASDFWTLDPAHVELMVDVDIDDPAASSYYFIDHENAVVFWIDEVSTDDIDIPDVSGNGHLRIYIQGEYWLHQEYFPCHRKASEKDECELVATLTHNCIDVITGNTSTSSFDRAQLESILGVMSNLKHTVGNHSQRNCIVARLWSEIHTARFINYYVFFLLLFDAPSTHLTTLRKFYVDKVVYTDMWRKSMEALTNDWHNMILWATVLLAVIQENQAVTCSLVSTLSSTSSIVIGLLLVRKHRPLTETHAADGSQYIERVAHPRLGMRPLAIVYSLPYACLMWAMATYIAAILLFVFKSGVSVVSQALIGSIAVGASKFES
ncbi:hypothetical protein JB92DRAFT_245273 [Gautieria morchelliformis]|nr:hypothetical protein JB92DRAFT_245273 [Gautieria morchelliformis]